MWGFIAAICFVIALVINLLVKGTDVKYALDFAYLGGIFIGVALATAGSWWPVRHGPSA